MRKLAFIFLIFFFCPNANSDWSEVPVVADAFMIIAQGGVPDGGDACVLKDSYTSGSGEWEIFYGSSFYHTATKFTTSSAYDVCKVEVELKDKNSPSQTMTIHAEIWTHDSTPNEPDTKMGSDSDDTISSADVTDTFTYYDWNWASGPYLSNATPYWLVLQSDEVDSLTNCIVINKGSDSGNKILGASVTDNPTSWSNDGTDDTYNIRVYGK